MAIIPAGPDHVAVLTDLALQLHGEFRDQLPRFDYWAASESIKASVLQPFSCIDLECRGALLLVETPYWFSRDRGLFDLMFYVRPDARGSRLAVEMLDYGKRAADAHGLQLRIGTSLGDPEKRDRFFARHGFGRAGGSYVWGRP